MARALSVALATLVALAACGGGSKAAPPNCGPPPPVPLPVLFLVYPEPNALNVPDSIGEIVFVGQTSSFLGPGTVTVAAPSGNVPVGAFTTPPLPIPTPNATPAGISGNIPYVAVPVPTLSPATTYALTFSFPDFGGSPPTCRTTQTQSLGSFTTR